jgi:PAS domain S-box-containing protein
MKILYIEDNLDDIELARRELHRAIPDLALTVHNSVAHGLAALQAQADYDIVLTDLRLPDGSGLEILSLARERQLSCAVIVLTGQGDEEIAVAAIKAGADDYVAKRNGYYRRLPQIVHAAINRFRVETTRKTGLLRVLYAEHNQVDVELTRRHLTKHAPHIQLDTVYSAAEVLTRMPGGTAEPSRCDVILLDFNLPDDNALELLKLLRDEHKVDIPVVLVTGQGDEEVAAQVLRLGAADYIVKHAGYLFELPVALENAHTRAALAREQAALRASEERFRRLAENARDLIYSYSFVPKRGFDYVSSAAVTMIGYTPEEHYADPELGYKIVHPDDRHLLDKSSSGNVDFSQPLTLRWIRKDGTVLWTEQRNTPIFDHQGQLIGIEGIARDVTAAMQARTTLEQHLAEIEALYHVSNALRTAQTQEEAVAILIDQTLSALHAEAAAVWLLNSITGNLETVATSGWCNAFYGTQLAPGEGIIGRVFATATPQVEHDILTSAHAAEALIPCTPQGWGAGWVPIRTSHEIVGVLFVSVPLPKVVTDEQVKLLLSLAEMAGSIIQRLRLLHDAQAQAELTRRIVNTVPEGLALLDSQGHILLANTIADDHLAVLSGANPAKAITQLGGRPLRTLLDAQSHGQEIEQGGCTYVLNSRPVEPDNPNTSWVLVLDDVTGERENQRYQEVQDRLATVGQLAAGIAHDFNNVLGVISVYSDILLMAPNLNPKQQGQLNTIVEQAHHAANLVRQVLDFSRRSVMERSQIDLHPLINEQIKLLRHTLPENIDLQLQFEHRYLVVHADATRLRQILMNLAINARDAMPQGGTLAFRLSRIDVAAGQAPLPDMQPGAWVRLEVNDSGSGIASAHLPHIFEPFFTTKAPGSGTGLGLAQVYGIVKQHGGAIDVTSTPGKGTVFTIYLPLAAIAADTDAAATAAPIARGNECILLVEDNSHLRNALADSLHSLGYHVISADNAATALALAGEGDNHIDLVLTDLVMPGMSGIELFAALKSLQPDAQMILMTGHPMTEARAKDMQHIQHWIQKPFALNTLADKVRLLLDEER